MINWTKCLLCGQHFNPDEGPCGCGKAQPEPTAKIKVSKLREWVQTQELLEGLIDGHENT